jgi:hypothetical protein
MPATGSDLKAVNDVGSGSEADVLPASKRRPLHPQKRTQIPAMFFRWLGHVRNSLSGVFLNGFPPPPQKCCSLVTRADPRRPKRLLAWGDNRGGINGAVRTRQEWPLITL